jgi:hypothetical protein
VRSSSLRFRALALSGIQPSQKEIIMKFSNHTTENRRIIRRSLAVSFAALSLAFAGAVAAADEAPAQKIELKDGGSLVVMKNGTTYHADAAGNRMKMRDDVVMEGKDGTKYLMKNDAVWRQLSEKGTMSAH